MNLYHKVHLYRMNTASGLTVVLPHGMTFNQIEHWRKTEYPDWIISATSSLPLILDDEECYGK